MYITIISIGKVKDDNFSKAISEYRKRLGQYLKLKEIELRAESFNEKNKIKAKNIEGNRIKDALASFDKEIIYLLSEHGTEKNTKDFSSFLDNNSNLVFVIAGSLGFSDDLNNSSYNKISLSKMTYPHELARLVLFEQIYRGMTIIKGKTYHY